VLGLSSCAGDRVIGGSEAALHWEPNSLQRHACCPPEERARKPSIVSFREHLEQFAQSNLESGLTAEESTREVRGSAGNRHVHTRKRNIWGLCCPHFLVMGGSVLRSLEELPGFEQQTVGEHLVLGGRITAVEVLP